jgi:uncharacterized protein
MTEALKAEAFKTGHSEATGRIEIVEGIDGDEIPCDDRAAPHFHDIVAARLRRRDVLAGGLSAAVAALFAGTTPVVRPAAAAPAGGGLLGFKPVPVARNDAVTVPDGYRVETILPWGEPILGRMPAFSPDNTGEDQAMQIGSHHDGLHFFPIDGRSDDGLFVMNHEYVEPRLMHRSARGHKLASNGFVLVDGRRPADEVRKEIAAHGVSVTRIRKGDDGRWRVVPDPRNRRITAATPAEIAGPVRGSDHLKTKFSPQGERTRGTLNNCAHGVTPWNTYMAAEENWAAYFHNGDTRDGKPHLPREHAEYRVRSGASLYRWHLADDGADEFVRFDASTRGAQAEDDYRNEPNTFGWMVEIDPFRSDSAPVKRTALGRFAHEGVVFAPAVEGRPVVCYSGDDATFQFVYKFVSADPYRKADAGGHLLDQGTLYAARFDRDGTGEWLALRFGENGLTPENGFRDQADVLVNTRFAARRAGATRMDRPEWGAVEPATGMVYFTMTNNPDRKEGDTDAVNPRAANRFGQIVRWTEEQGDHAATRFRWELFLLGGDADTGRDLAGRPLGGDSLLACPDGLWFDADGRLWIQTDIGESGQNKGPYTPFGNNAMLCADPKTGEIRRFLTGPVGQEITGVVTTPDGRTMFVNVQHPGATTTPDNFAAGRLDSHWPDGGEALPRSATLVISRIDGGVIGGPQDSEVSVAR